MEKIGFNSKNPCKINIDDVLTEKYNNESVIAYLYKFLDNFYINTLNKSRKRSC